MFHVAKVRAVPWLPVLLSACCIYANTLFATAHGGATTSSDLNCNPKCCTNDTMQQFMNMSCTLGKLVGRANVTFSTLKNVGTMALEELSALTGSSAKRPLGNTLDDIETVLSDIERCVNSTIPSEIFDTEHNSCNTVCLQVLKESYQHCKTDTENNERLLTGVFHAGGRDFAEQLGGLNKKLSSYWNETYKLANASHHEAERVDDSIQNEFKGEEGSCESSPECEEDSFSKFSEGMREIYLRCGGSEEEAFKGFNDNITNIMEPVLTSAMKAHEIAAKLKARQAEAEAMKDHECVPLFKQFLNMFPS